MIRFMFAVYIDYPGVTVVGIMSVIIRLQNLPWAANAADIRQYFQGLSIPEGGVHIVGGEKGDAFISFSTDEDARQAMLADGGCIKEVQIRLLLSSRNEMQKVIETARQQAMQLTQVYMQQMQQPQLPIVGSLQPPLTAKVLPQPQQQPLRPDRLHSNLMHRNPPIMDPAAMLISQDKVQQQSENKDRDDKSHKRERTRSKSRDRRSKSSRSGGGGSSSRRDRSRSRDRRRRDRSRGRDRSRDRYRGSGGDRNSSSRSSGGKPHRSKSPGKTPISDQQIKPWASQYDGMQQQQVDNNHLTLTANVNDCGPMFSQFRTPPQPPIIHSNTYQPQQQQLKLPVSVWGPAMQGGERQQQSQYVPNKDFRANVYGDADGSDDEDDRQTEFDNNAPYKRYNDNTGPSIRRGPPGQDFHNQQQGFSGRGGGPRFNKPQQPMPGGLYQHGGGQRHFNDFGSGSGPRFNNQHPRYKMADDGGGISESGGRGGRQSRFSSVHEGGRPSRFNPLPVQHKDNAGPEPDDNAKVPPRINDRYRYDVRNAQAPAQLEGLCVEVNNMTNHFSYGDIRKLFEGIHIDGSAIKIQKHRKGVAFVRFDNNHNKNMAMQLSGTAYKGNRVEVKHLDDISYERENTDNRPYPNGQPAPTIVDHVDLVDDDDENEQPPQSSDDVDNNKKQHVSTDDKSDDGHLVVCEKSGVKDMTVEDNKKQSNEKQDPPTKFLKLQQLPITVTEEDVLSEIDGGGDVRRVTFYPDGEFKGAALEFQSVDTAEAALKRFDCVLLGSTPVPVLRCTYKEYTQIKRMSNGGGSGSKRFSNDGGRHHYNQQHVPVDTSLSSMPQPPLPPTMPVPPTIRTNCIYLHGLPTTVTNTDITQFFSDMSILPDKIHIMLSKFGRPTGESYCEFGTAQQANTALSKDQSYMGPCTVTVEAISRPDMIQAITKPMQQRNQQDLWGGGMRPPRHLNNMMQPSPRHLQGPPGPSFGGNGPNGTFGGGRYINNGGIGGRGGAGYTPRMRGPGPGPNTGPDGFGQPGCVVALDNVPYRADVQEIVDFFEGFDLNSQNVIRRFNDFGKPTGEARVNLRNPQEAIRALRVLQNKPIFNRPVRLQLL